MYTLLLSSCFRACKQAAAVNLGAEFCSEMIIYLIAGATVVYETRG